MVRRYSRDGIQFLENRVGKLEPQAGVDAGEVWWSKRAISREHYDSAVSVVFGKATITIWQPAKTQ